MSIVHRCVMTTILIINESSSNRWENKNCTIIQSLPCSRCRLYLFTLSQIQKFTRLVHYSKAKQKQNYSVQESFLNMCKRFRTIGVWNNNCIITTMQWCSFLDPPCITPCDYCESVILSIYMSTLVYVRTFVSVR